MSITALALVTGLFTACSVEGQDEAMNEQAEEKAQPGSYSFSFGSLLSEQIVNVPKQPTVSAVRVTLGWRQTLTGTGECTNPSTTESCYLNLGAETDIWTGEVTPVNRGTVYVSLDSIPAGIGEASFDAELVSALAESTAIDVDPAMVELPCPFDGTIDFAGPSSGTGSASSRHSETITITDPSVLAQFQGTGTTSLFVGHRYFGTTSTCGNAALTTSVGTAARIRVELLP